MRQSTHQPASKRGTGETMTKHLLAIITLPLAVLAGCEVPNGNDPTNDGGSVTDGGSTSGYSFEIIAHIPSLDVEVYITHVPYAGQDEPTMIDAIATCDVQNMVCRYTVPHSGTYKVEAEGDYTFITKEVVAHIDEDGGQEEVFWSLGGCASDSDWTPDGPCESWTPGEYGFPPLAGSYTDEVWGREASITIKLDGSITIENVTGSSDATMSGYEFYGSTDSSWWAGTVINEETFSMTKLNAVNGMVDEFVFHRN